MLSRVDGVKGYHDITRDPDARVLPGLMLLRCDASQPLPGVRPQASHADFL